MAGSVLIVLLGSLLVGAIVVALATFALLYIRALDDPLPPPPPRTSGFLSVRRSVRPTAPAGDGGRPDVPHVGKSTPPTSAH